MKEKEAGEKEERKIVEIAGKKVRYIDPLTDWGFKRLFGTEANKEILSGFLEVLFPDKVIRDIRYLNPEQLGLTREDRKSVFDVCCKTDSGEEFIVEMQKERQTYFRDRALPVAGAGAEGRLELQADTGVYGGDTRLHAGPSGWERVWRERSRGEADLPVFVKRE